MQGLITDVTKSIPQLKDAGAKANAALDAFISAAKDLKPATTSKPSTTSKPATTKTTTTPKATLT